MGFKNVVWDLLKYTHGRVLQHLLKIGAIYANGEKSKIKWCDPLKWQVIGSCFAAFHPVQSLNSTTKAGFGPQTCRLKIVLEAPNESKEGDYWSGLSPEKNIKVHIQ